MIDITSQNFDAEVAQSQTPVVVLWGGKTNITSNIYSYVLTANVKIALKPPKLCRIDLTESADLAMQFSIRNEPYLMLFVDGLAMAADADLPTFWGDIKQWIT